MKKRFETRRIRNKGVAKKILTQNLSKLEIRSEFESLEYGNIVAANEAGVSVLFGPEDPLNFQVQPNLLTKNTL